MKNKHFIFIIQNNNKNRKHIKVKNKQDKSFLKKLKHEPSLKKPGGLHGYPLYILFQVSVRPVVLLGGKGVRVSTLFINAFQKKKVWNLPKSSSNLSDFKTCLFSPQNVAISKLFFFPSWKCGDLVFFGNFPKCSFHHVCFHGGLFNRFSSQKINIMFIFYFYAFSVIIIILYNKNKVFIFTFIFLFIGMQV